MMLATGKPIQEFTNIKTNSIVDAITEDQDQIKKLLDDQAV